MNKPIVFMFSGQGTHYFQMGREMYRRHGLFRKWMKDLDSMVYDLIHDSVCEKLYADKNKMNDPFLRTLHSHPAIFMVEYAMAQVLLNEGIKPDCVMGVSMGEFASAAVSGVLSLEESLQAVIKQAEVIEENCREGKMIALLENVKLFNDTPILNKYCELAAVNFDSHFVISLQSKDVERIVHYLKKEEIDYQEIPVSYGYHTSFLNPAKKVYGKVLKNMTFNSPKISYISCILTDLLEKIPENYYWDIVRKPILFQETIEKMENRNNYLYIDLGPSGTLANFIKYIVSDGSRSRSMPVLTPFNQDLINVKRIKELLSDNMGTGK